LCKHENSWPFREPVDIAKVPDYYDNIKNPMDLKTVRKKVEKEIADGGYSLIGEFKRDIAQIFENARTYNQKETIYYKYANQLEMLVKHDLERL
jgi:histone acetyltransferase